MIVLLCHHASCYLLSRATSSEFTLCYVHCIIVYTMVELFKAFPSGTPRWLDSILAFICLCNVIVDLLLSGRPAYRAHAHGPGRGAHMKCNRPAS